MKKLLVIVGPTGTGKTSLALSLAKKFSGELISADSRQIFEGMDVGTGKVELGETVKTEKSKGKWMVDGIPIHLYDLISPEQNFSVAQFQQEALKVIEEIQNRGKLPILVGGTGLYIQAVTEGLNIPKVAPDQKLREKLEKKATETLLIELKEVDPKTFEKVDKANRRRIIRALEVTYLSGKPFSELKEKYSVNFDLLILGLTSKREALYKRTDQRIDQWFDSGKFEEEVRSLLKKYPANLASFTSLGYQDVIGLIGQRLTPAEARQRTKFKHHGYIRRQLTWFRRMGNVNWLNSEELGQNEVQSEIEAWLKGNT